MFYRYEIKNNGVENILYLYLTMNYEFSKDLTNSSDDTELRRRTTNFIKNNGINFDSGKVYLVIDDIIVKAFQIPKKESISILTERKNYDDLSFMVTLKLEDNSIIEITLYDYLLGAVATNMISDLPINVLKAMVILYRGYAFKQMREQNIILAINEFVIYKPIDYFKIAFAPNYENIVSSIKKAITETDGIFISYQKDYILPFIHISNHGFTLEDKRYPYLSSVSSLWDITSPFYVDSLSFTYQFLSKVFNLEITKDSKFKILECSPYGKVLKLSINDKIIDGKKFTNLLHLKSQFLSIILNNNDVTIITKGFGDCLGLSIFGARALANNGCDFANILNYYFPKTTICEYKKEL